MGYSLGLLPGHHDPAIQGYPIPGRKLPLGEAVGPTSAACHMSAPCRPCLFSITRQATANTNTRQHWQKALELLGKELGMFAQHPPADEEDPPVLRVMLDRSMRHSLQGSRGTVACETPKRTRRYHDDRSALRQRTR
jgi:hypothetical protein